MSFHVAILTFPGFNEIDSIVALGLLNRVRDRAWRITLCCPEQRVTSMNGVTVDAQSRLEDARTADAVIVGSAILRWLEDVARTAGARTIGLECRRSHAVARNFYGELGYHEHAIARGYYRGREDAVRLEKWLVPPAG